MSSIIKRAAGVALALTVAGCAGTGGGPGDTSPPVPVTPQPSAKPAVVALLDRAKGQAEEGAPEQAVATLERALRIEPRNPLLWHRLARLRFDMGMPARAIQLALKSNALSGDGASTLARQNWRLIAQARLVMGDPKGAREALKSAGEID